jgi:hypothetical protein
LEAIVTKYEKLGPFLRQQDTSEISMTFDEVEEVIGHPLPASSRYPAWWSNNPFNNVMTKVWLKVGFKTEQVDIEGRKLVFRRVAQPEQQRAAPAIPMDTPAEPRSPAGMADDALPYSGPANVTPETQPRCRHPAFGSMKGLIQIAPGVDLTKPAADPDSWKFRG